MTDQRPPPVVHQNGSMIALGTGVIDAVKTLPPTLLVIVILNIAMTLSAGWYLTNLESSRAELVRLMLERCLVKSDK